MCFCICTCFVGNNCQQKLKQLNLEEIRKMFVFLYFVLSLMIVTAFANNVPVCMWGTVPLLDKIPAFTVLDENTFKNNLSKILTDTLLVVFAETSLSAEDFVNTEKFGEEPFPFLREQEITYLQNVENPIQTWKRLPRNILEIPSENFRVENLTGSNQTETVLIIGLDAPNSTQNRFDLLKRHDAFINSTYNKIINKFKNVIAIYSGFARTQFQSLAVSPYQNFYKTSHVLLRVLPKSTFQVDPRGKPAPLGDFTVLSRNVEKGIAVTIANKRISVDIQMEIGATYWTIKTIEVNNFDPPEQLVSFIMKPITRVSLKSSYFCNVVKLSSKNYFFLTLYGLLIQPNLMNQTQFSGNMENCIGFFSVPILAGVGLSAFFVFIALIAITLLMDIKTMDRFNDSRHSIVTAPAAD